MTMIQSILLNQQRKVFTRTGWRFWNGPVRAESSGTSVDWREGEIVEMCWTLTRKILWRNNNSRCTQTHLWDVKYLKGEEPSYLGLLMMSTIRGQMRRPGFSFVSELLLVLPVTAATWRWSCWTLVMLLRTWPRSSPCQGECEVRPAQHLNTHTLKFSGRLRFQPGYLPETAAGEPYLPAPAWTHYSSSGVDLSPCQTECTRRVSSWGVLEPSHWLLPLLRASLCSRFQSCSVPLLHSLNN